MIDNKKKGSLSQTFFDLKEVPYNEQRFGRTVLTTATQSNKLIRSRFKFKLTELKLWHFLIGKLDHTQPAKGQLPILSTVTELQNALGWNDRSKWNHLRSLTLSMRENASVVIPDEKKGKIIDAFVFPTIRWGMDGVVEFEVNPEVQPYIFELKDEYTVVPYKQIVDMNSSYSLRLYEILKSWLGKKDEETYLSNFKWSQYDLPTIYKTLSAPKSYSWYDFKRKILDVALKEIDQKTDISCKFTRKVGYKNKTEGIVLVYSYNKREIRRNNAKAMVESLQRGTP